MCVAPTSIIPIRISLTPSTSSIRQAVSAVAADVTVAAVAADVMVAAVAAAVAADAMVAAAGEADAAA